MEMTRDVFDQQRLPRFGTANPERMRLEFWEWMIRGDPAPPPDEGSPLNKIGLLIREGVLKSRHGPARARDLFQIPRRREDGPIWAFDRMGATRTSLSDGRIVCVGGEHEDYYDPDFCIYNDVVVLGPGDRVEIYGYPRGDFPPTDFHTATPVGDRIILIGRLGAAADRRPGHTPVHALDLSDYRISTIETSGEGPGWLSRHEAEYDTRGTINVRGGEVAVGTGRGSRLRRNGEDYALDLGTGVWRRLTSRNWSQFSIEQASRGAFWREQAIDAASLYPRGIDHIVVPHERRREVRFLVAGIPINVKSGIWTIDVVVEGNLPTDFVEDIAEEIRANAEAACQRPCKCERLSP